MSRRSDQYLIPESPDFTFERALWRQGITAVAGIDEAGRGPIAGPVAVGAVVLPAEETIPAVLSGVRDSKQMGPEERTAWTAIIQEVAVAFSVATASVEEIDSLGIVQAVHLAAQRALLGLPVAPQHLLIDYFSLTNSACPQTAIVKGDQRSLSIAAASVLAKTSRDALLVEADSLYPGYGFASHKGYCTAAHQLALEKLGPCSYHRKTFRPISTAAEL
jgi:ribonuclease HII